MKTYTFELYSSGLSPEWDEYEYFSKDISVCHRQPMYSERACFIAVLEDEGLLTDRDLAYTITLTSLEQILIENNIYVKFIDGENYEEA
ncbi:MAG: hypothetical protein M0R77_07880 [Gammaproteobacteria bacterium]|nr:hypothetical protein [Gammaproteobacteria bacterium]